MTDHEYEITVPLALSGSITFSHDAEAWDGLSLDEKREVIAQRAAEVTRVVNNYGDLTPDAPASLYVVIDDVQTGVDLSNVGVEEGR